MVSDVNGATLSLTAVNYKVAADAGIGQDNPKNRATASKIIGIRHLFFIPSFPPSLSYCAFDYINQ